MSRPTSYRSALPALVALLLLGLAGPSFGASADADPGFGNSGLVTQVQDAFGPNKIVVLNGITTQPDGNVVVVGELDSTSGDNEFSSFIARFLSNGDLDVSFAGSGYRNHDIDSLRDAAFEVLVQADGKIVVAGQTQSHFGFPPTSGNIFVVRYNSDGSTDTSFGSDGVITIDRPGAEESLLGMALRSDGSIIVAGSTNSNGETNSIFACVTSAGSLDASFGAGNGVVVHALGANGNGTDYASGIDLYPNGKIIFTGPSGSSTNANTLAGRLNADGSLDTSFANGVGYRTLTTLNTNQRDFGDEVMLLPDGKILIAATIDTTTANRASLAVLRLLPDGTLDSSFNTTGVVLIGPGNGSNISIFNAAELARQPDGKILVVGAEAEMQGDSGDFVAETAKAVVARLNPDGSIDTSFDADDGIIRQNFGVTAVYPRATTLQADGKLLLAGRARKLVSGSNHYTSSVTARLTGDIADIDTTPEPITFDSITDVTPSSMQLSNTGSVNGLSAGIQVPIRISNGEYTLDGSTFTSEPGWAVNGDQISVRHQASGLGNSQTITTLSVGGVASPFNNHIVLGTAVTPTFSSSTLTVDTTPSTFTLNDQSDVTLDYWIVSNTVTIEGIAIAVPVAISNGEYSIGCTDTFTATSASISNGQTVCVRQRSATTISTTTSSTLTVGGLSEDFTVTTAAVMDSIPDGFAFVDQTGLGRNATVTSNTLTVSGLTTAVTVSVAGSGGYSIGCTNTFINTASQIANGQTVCLRHLAANAYNSTVTTSLTIGSVSDTFTSTTTTQPSSGGGGGGGSADALALLVLSMLLMFGKKKRRTWQ